MYDENKQQTTMYIDHIEEDLDPEIQKQFRVLNNGKLLIDQIKSDDEGSSRGSNHVSKITVFQPNKEVK